MPSQPKFKDFRATSDGVMVADIGFKRQLWALDKELDVVWDWASEKWEIWRFPGQAGVEKKRMDEKAFHMMTIQTKDRTFRELGADILLKLQKGDPTRYSLDELCDYFDKIDENIRRAKYKEFMNKMEWLEQSVREWWTKFKSQVPLSYGVKPSDSRLLIRVTPGDNRGPKIFKVPKNQKITNAIVGG